MIFGKSSSVFAIRTKPFAKEPSLQSKEAFFRMQTSSFCTANKPSLEERGERHPHTTEYAARGLSVDSARKAKKYLFLAVHYVISE